MAGQETLGRKVVGSRASITVYFGRKVTYFHFQTQTFLVPSLKSLKLGTSSRFVTVPQLDSGTLCPFKGERL